MKFALYFIFCTVFHFLALYFETTALLLANQNWDIFSCILWLFFMWLLHVCYVTRVQNQREIYMATLYLVVFRSDVRNTSPIRTFYRNAIFRRIIATEKCCFAQLLKVVHSVFPYRIGAFSRRYAESYPVYIYGASVVKWLAHLPFTSKAEGSSLSENSPNATRTQSSR